MRYDAIREYSKSGKEPYKQVPGEAKFSDYLKGQPEKFQKEWLGVKRHELYKAGKLDLKDLVKPNNGFKKTVADLKAEIREKTEWRDGWSASFWEKVDEIKGYNLSKEIVVSPEILQAMKEHGFRNVDEFADKINEYVKSHDVLHRFRLRDILQQLADEPILKNQFETGTTNSGFLSPEGRKRLENVISGGKSDDMLPRERPVYGYVSDVKKTVKPVEGYGDTTVVFKNSVRNRMTFTIGNSSSEQGAFYDDVRAIFNKGRNTGMESRPRFIELAADIIKGKQESHSPEWYLESQIWGSADLRQDVSEIAIGINDLQNIAGRVEYGTWQRFKKQMDSANVRIVHYANYTAEQIKEKMPEWELLQADAKKLGIPIINIAR